MLILRVTYVAIYWNMLIFKSNAFPFVFPKAADAVSRAADETSVVQDLDFSTLRSQLGPLVAV